MNLRYKKVVLGVIIFLVWSQKLAAQINESDTLKMQLQLSLTGNYQQGNVNILRILSRNEFLIRPVPNWAFKTQVTSLYTKFSDTQADNNIFTRNALYYKPENRFYGYVTAFVSTNYRRKIEFRYFVAAGPTWQAIQSDPLILKLSANLVRESTFFAETNFNVPSYNGNDVISLWRSTFYVGGWINALDHGPRVNYEFYWQPALNNSKNYRTQLEVGLTYPIWKGLAFNLVYSHSHENVVVENIGKNDQVLSLGLSYLLRKNNN